MSKNFRKKKIPLLLLAVSAILLAAAVAAVNYTVDPAGVFTTGEEQRAVEILLSGQSAANLDNYNERFVKRQLAGSIGPVDTLALGSSRAALITREMAGGGSFFNLSVAGAMLQEAVGLYGLYYESYGPPQRVLLVVDPWFLSEDYQSGRFRQSVGDGFYSYASSRMGMEELDGSDYQVSALYSSPDGAGFFELELQDMEQVLSVSYFQQSLKELFDGESRKVHPTSLQQGEVGILRSDGSYSYPASYVEVDEQTVAARGRDTGLIGLGSYDLESGRMLPMLLSFLDSLLEDGVQVELLLMPINPATYESSVQQGVPMQAIEQALGEAAAERGVQLTGSFDPAALGAGYGDFYDAYHPRPEFVRGLLEEAGIC